MNISAYVFCAIILLTALFIILSLLPFMDDREDEAPIDHYPVSMQEPNSPFVVGNKR